MRKLRDKNIYAQWRRAVPVWRKLAFLPLRIYICVCVYMLIYTYKGYYVYYTLLQNTSWEGCVFENMNWIILIGHCILQS